MSDERENPSHEEPAASAPQEPLPEAVGEAPAPEGAPQEGSPELAASAEGSPPASGSLEPEGEGFFARLRNAFKGFFRGLRGLPVEIPPGEEGTIPVAEAMAAQRRYEKKIAKLQGKQEKLQAQLAEREQQIAEREAAVKESQKELKRAKAAAGEAEAELRRENEKLQRSLDEQQERAQHLQSELTGRDARLAQRDQELETRGRELEDARLAAVDREKEWNRQVEELRGQMAERSGQLEKTEEARAKLAARTAELDEQLRQATERAEGERKESERMRDELAARQRELEELRGQMDAAEAKAQAALDEAKGELEFVKSTLVEKESAMQLLLGEVQNQESEADREREESQHQQAALREDIEEWKRRHGEAEAAGEKLRGEMASLLASRTELDSAKARAAQLEREAGKRLEEAGMLRDDLVAHRKRVAELEVRMRELGELEGQKAGFQRELQRQSVQLEALRSQFTEAQLKVEKLGEALRDFHAPAVSALQVVAVYAESLAASLALSESDRADAQELKQNVEKLRQTLQKLTAKLAELGIPHS